MEAALTDRKKKFAVMLNKLYERVQNKEKRCTMMELGY
jgi:hypothetical protein